MNEKGLIELVKDFDKEVLRKRENTMEGIFLAQNQVEGWLKGELIGFLHADKNLKYGTQFKTEIPFGEVKPGKQKAFDFEIKDNWIEAKQILIGEQNKTNYKASSYLYESELKDDVDKLLRKKNAYLTSMS